MSSIYMWGSEDWLWGTAREYIGMPFTLWLVGKITSRILHGASFVQVGGC